MTKSDTLGQLPQWGRDVHRSTVDGHPCLTYAQRPPSLASLLLDARRWPDRRFVTQGDRELSGRVFESVVAATAAHLKTQGVAAGDRVLLLGFNSLEWIAAFWAASALGAAPVLGNAWWSDTEVGAIVALVEPTLVISDRDVGGCTRISFGDLTPHLTVATGRRLCVAEVDEDDEALVIFSSGTTGAPKAVSMSHRTVVGNLQNLLVLTGRLPHEIPKDRQPRRSLLTVPLFHLAGVQVLCLNLVTGGEIFMLEGRFRAEEVLRLIEDEEIRTWGSIPTMVSRVLSSPAFANHDLSSLRSIQLGGATVSPELRQRISEGFPSVRQGGGSLYGSTEAGGVLAAGSGPQIRDRPGCVGRALPVVELRIAHPDAEGVGEIQARTPTATRGYLGDPDPMCDLEGWVSMGDLGRIDEDGWLYVTGRSKDIIIRGGENVASVNVARHIESHPDVEEAVALALPHDDLGEQIGVVAVITPRTAVTVADLDEHARRHLGRHEIPDVWWLRHAALPTTASGKVLTRELRGEWLVAGCETITVDPVATHTTTL